MIMAKRRYHMPRKCPVGSCCRRVAAAACEMLVIVLSCIDVVHMFVRMAVGIATPELLLLSLTYDFVLLISWCCSQLFALICSDGYRGPSVPHGLLHEADC